MLPHEKKTSQKSKKQMQNYELGQIDTLGLWYSRKLGECIEIQAWSSDGWTEAMKLSSGAEANVGSTKTRKNTIPQLDTKMEEAENFQQKVSQLGERRFSQNKPGPDGIEQTFLEG